MQNIMFDYYITIIHYLRNYFKIPEKLLNFQ